MKVFHKIPVFFEGWLPLEANSSTLYTGGSHAGSLGRQSFDSSVVWRLASLFNRINHHDISRKICKRNLSVFTLQIYFFFYQLN